ncbi:MAG: hypothetical protein RR061_06045 [Muribaculaceae bacterium]
MEEKELDEKESIKLISQMIANSKNRLKLGSGNTFLLWGYITTIVALAVWSLVYFTGNGLWCFGWFAIPIIGWPFTYFLTKRTSKQVITYTDKVIDNIWAILGIMSFFAIVVLMITNTMNIMLPLTLILCGIGTSFTGIVIRDRWLTFLPAISFIIGLYLLGVLVQNKNTIDITWFLIFGACFVIMMIIPGHLLNSKAKKENV